MPNNCYNTLRIIGPAADIKDMVEHRLSFQHYVPCAPGADVDAHVEAWGTKWEAYDLEVKYADEFEACLKFVTAWGPPITFLEKLNVRFPDCWFKLEYTIELGWGSGIWIHWLSPKRGTPMVRSMAWDEPEPYPAVNGKILLPADDSDDE